MQPYVWVTSGPVWQQLTLVPLAGISTHPSVRRLLTVRASFATLPCQVCNTCPLLEPGKLAHAMHSCGVAADKRTRTDALSTSVHPEAHSATQRHWYCADPMRLAGVLCSRGPVKPLGGCAPAYVQVLVRFSSDDKLLNVSGGSSR